MSKYEAELKRRLLSEPFEQVRDWYFECLNDDDFDWRDPTLRELKFFVAAAEQLAPEILRKRYQ
jgi:hypothetical protein